MPNMASQKILIKVNVLFRKLEKKVLLPEKASKSHEK